MNDARDVVTDTDTVVSHGQRVPVPDAVGSGPGGVVSARDHGTPVDGPVPPCHE